MSVATDVLDRMIADPSINGQHVDVDKAFGGQCWDLVELFAERCGVPKEPWAITLGPQQSAKEAWTVFDAHMRKYFDKIPAGQQQKGDITVYDGHGAYPEGHIAISLGGSAVFEENADPDGSAAHTYGSRSSTYLLGALRLKGANDMSAIDLGGVRILNFAIAGNDGEDGRPNALTGALDSALQGHVGQDALDEIHAWYNSPAAENYRQNVMPSVFGERNALRAKVIALQKEIDTGILSDKSKQILADMQAIIDKYK